MKKTILTVVIHPIVWVTGLLRLGQPSHLTLCAQAEQCVGKLIQREEYCNGSRTCATTEPVPGRKPVLALLIPALWTVMLVLTAFGAQAGVVLTSLYSFTGTNDGANPVAGLVQGSDGNFYGTTLYGGTSSNGTVFKISSNGALTSLYSFTGTNDGAKPYAGLVQGSDSNFYGTTAYGGTSSAGTVFKISSNEALTSLHSFTGVLMPTAISAALLNDNHVVK